MQNRITKLFKSILESDCTAKIGDSILNDNIVSNDNAVSKDYPKLSTIIEISGGCIAKCPFCPSRGSFATNKKFLDWKLLSEWKFHRKVLTNIISCDRNLKIIALIYRLFVSQLEREKKTFNFRSDFVR